MAYHGTSAPKPIKSTTKRKPKAKKKQRKTDEQPSGPTFADMRGPKTTPLSRF
jgi:hypothetical protein